MSREKASAPVAVDLQGFPHNGEGRPDLMFPDPINGDLIGGQVAAMRMNMRYQHTVYPWARRQGKTKFRQFKIQNRATLTTGPYWAGIVFPDHTTAAKIAMNFRDSWGGMVKNSKINDKDQDRWIELHPLVPPPGPPPTWFTPEMMEQWHRCQKGEGNTSIKLYCWGGAFPHFQKIQGFPHPFHDVDWDEAQQIHPDAYAIVQPMLRDIRGHECISGTPWSTGIGNYKFEKFWNIAGKESSEGWFRMRVPDGANPHVPAVEKSEMLGMTDSEIRQTMYAEFLSGEGAVFGNLDNVIVLPHLKAQDPALNWIRALRSKYAMPTMEWWVNRPEPPSGHILGASIDWARSPKGDYSVLSIMDLSTGNQLALLRWRGEDFTAQMEVVLAVQEHYGAEQLHSDANGMGMTMSDFMRRRHAVGFVGHRFGKNKPDYVRRGQVLFQDEDVHLIKCTPQWDEFKSYSAFEAEGIGSEKQVKYAAPVGEHDDIVSSFLHLAPTLTIVGRQTEAAPEEEAPPMFDEKGETTLDLFTEGQPLPWQDEEDDLSWNSVVLPPRML